ncbi:Sulfate starvation-induced protein 1 [Serratia fonticola]|uniref:Sulfate starvation-induced protein 1 n=1 Tax=Serratia fonticola TaxID=47917 RepID=A0A4V6KW56_SERFO|nr:Sulfate starvation-induced protein 1 [Serratia fonticola]
MRWPPGDVQIGNIGSSPLAVAASQKLPIEVFLIASQLGSSEALVVKKDIKSPQDLIGKRIAVPFISTTHYSLLASLKHWASNLTRCKFSTCNRQPLRRPGKRGDIDGAYVWAPVVNELAKQGKVLTDSEQVGQWGSPTLDVWVVRKDFAEQHPEVVTAFAASALKAQKAYLAQPEQWLKDSSNLNSLARLSGVPPEQVPELVKGNRYLPVADQITPTGPAGR